MFRFYSYAFKNIFILYFATICVHSLTTSIVDICNWKISPKIKNISSDYESEHRFVSIGDIYVIIIPTNSLTWPINCSIDLMTCSSCHFQLTIQSFNVSKNSRKSCPNCITVNEPLFKKLPSTSICFISEESNSKYAAMSKWVSLMYKTVNSECDSNFRIVVKAKENKFIFREKSGVISSPHFPLLYPIDYSAEYIIQNEDYNHVIEIVFSDFNLYSPWSYLEIFDSNSSKISALRNNIFRPPAIKSTANNISIVFVAGNHIIDQLTRSLMYSNKGFFRLEYNTATSNDSAKTVCGGNIDLSAFGGGAVHMNTNQHSMYKENEKNLDCTWILNVQPQLKYDDANSFYYLSLKVVNFKPSTNDTFIQIIQGQNSIGKSLENVTYQTNIVEEHIVFSKIGFYVRLKGYVNSFLMVYSLFKYSHPCTSIGHFQCSNGRCIRRSLRCDGIDHCNDASDELHCTFIRNPHLNSFYYHGSPRVQSTANYFFISLTILGMGLFIASASLIIGKVFHQQNNYSSGDSQEGTEINLLVADETNIDSPPSYTEAVKVCPPPIYQHVSTSFYSQSNSTTKEQICSCEGACACFPPSHYCKEKSNPDSNKCFSSANLKDIDNTLDSIIECNSESSAILINNVSNSVSLRRTQSCHFQRPNSLKSENEIELFFEMNLIPKKWKSIEVI